MDRTGTRYRAAMKPARMKKRARLLKAAKGSDRSVSVCSKGKSVLLQRAHSCRFHNVKRAGIYDRYIGPALEKTRGLVRSSLDIISGETAERLEDEMGAIDERLGEIDKRLRSMRQGSVKKRKKRSKFNRRAFDAKINHLYSEKASLEVRGLLLNSKLDRLYGEGSRPKYRSYGLMGMNTAVGQARNFDIQLAPVVISSTSMMVQKVTSVGVNAYFLPGSVFKFLEGAARKSYLSNLKQQYSSDKELMQVVQFLENKHFVYTDLVGLVGSVAGIGFGAQEIGSWMGLNENMLVGMGKIEKWTKTGVVTGVAGFVYKKGYDLHLMRNAGYWKNILEETEPGFEGEKSEDLLALEKEVGDRFREENLSLKKLKNIVRSKAVLGLLENDRGAVAYTMFMRLKKEGMRGPMALLLGDLGLTEVMIGNFNELDKKNEVHVKLACDTFVQVFRM